MDAAHGDRGRLAADSMHPVRPSFLTANAQIHPITAPATFLRSRALVPNDQRAQTSESHRIAALSSPGASNLSVPRESGGPRHRTHSRYFHLRFGTSTLPADHAEVH